MTSVLAKPQSVKKTPHGVSTKIKNIRRLEVGKIFLPAGLRI